MEKCNSWIVTEKWWAEALVNLIDSDPKWFADLLEWIDSDTPNKTINWVDVITMLPWVFATKDVIDSLSWLSQNPDLLAKYTKDYMNLNDLSINSDVKDPTQPMNQKPLNKPEWQEWLTSLLNPVSNDTIWMSWNSWFSSIKNKKKTKIDLRGAQINIGQGNNTSKQDSDNDAPIF